ncbi:class I SAM-dependent methyltransferase [Chthonobacter rhizosphaerae]|uniref:class I SAM-dependent methyltransferase n=1 Tax=Chthonobacter rhizosphaerae TaxID=2735553 RepID=UPI0015EF9CA7|nr:methyltransferase domain-containing protein [Chthonobacter rhizosphaerae]
MDRPSGHAATVDRRPGNHAAAMDRMYRYTRHIYDITRKPYLLGRDRMIAELDVPPGGTVLELGCGTGRNLVAVARRYPDCRLFGVDISAEMLHTAGATIDAAGLTHRITLSPGDATAFDAASAFGLPRFDRVYFSYAVSMIPDWVAALKEADRLTAPGGRLAVVDFGDAAHLGALPRRLLHGWLALFHVTPRVDLAARMHTLATGRTVRHTSLHGGYAQIGTIG